MPIDVVADDAKGLARRILPHFAEARNISWVDEEAAVFAMIQINSRNIVTKHMSEINFVSSAEDGDIIEIDIPDRRINVAISNEELAARRSKEEAKGAGAFTPADRNRTVSTALKAYALFAASADKGAIRVLPE